MGKNRWAQKTDKNQQDILDQIRKVPGLKAEAGHDDILVGYKGLTYWFEIKTGPKADIRDSQTKLLNEWTGHYQIVWSVEQILETIGVSCENI